MKIDPDGYKFIVFLLSIGLACGGAYAFDRRWPWLCMLVLFVVAGCYTAFFFRDPERTAPGESDAAVSAADGVVVDVGRVPAEGFEGGEALRIAVFMSVFNVHVNRTPLAGTVVRTIRRPGKKLSALSARAERENEYGDTDIETDYGLVRIRQIAGLIARRVVTRVKRGDRLDRGDRIGLIRLGSRVDVFLPLTFRPVVGGGDVVRAGESVIARPAPRE